MIKKILPAVAGLLFICNLSSLAMEKDDPIMVSGIRPMGMGGAFTAVADDENSVFYNPAGITQRTGDLIQIFNVNAAVSGDAIAAVNDLSKVASNINAGGDDNSKVDDLVKINDSIADKDINFSLSVFNPAYISAPMSVGNNGNSISFGAGIFNSASIGVKAGMHIPQFMLDFMQIATNGDLTDQNALINSVPDSMLNASNILKPGVTAADVRNAIAAGEDWTWISNNLLSTQTGNLIDQIQSIADDSSLADGDKYTQIVNALSNFASSNPNWANWSIDGAHASATIKSYATATLDVPFAYKFDSLDALHLPGKLSLGVNLKYIQRVKFAQTVIIDNSQVAQLLNGAGIDDVINTKAGVSYGQGYGLDFGMMYSLTPRWNFGLQVSDVFTNIDYNQGYSLNKDYYPDSDFTHMAYIAPQLNIGASYIPKSILGWDTKNRLMFAADIRDITGNYTDSFKNQTHIGAEYKYGCLALRLGLNQLRPSAGIGVEFNVFQLSYAFYGAESELAKALGNPDQTVYYHQLQIAFKIGNNKGRTVEENKKVS